ncbi:MAG: GNAT family N-acetyltransferase [Flavobacteriaceae bacterium]|nr:GNAT family N-acetyltransferase [Flavobacteriaceae bacterium]
MIRLAKVQEIEEIMSITRACAVKMISEGIYQWNEHYPHIEAFQNDLMRNELYVLIEENKLVGSITISTVKDEEYIPIKWLTEDNLNYYIHRLAIDPTFQHKGYARKLMDFAEDFAKKKQANSIRLDTFSKNRRNQRFYESRGYRRLGNIYFPKQSEHPFYCYELVLN